MDQLNLPNVAVEKVVDGVEMGVLEDGTAYLTGRGLAKVCGVANSNIFAESKAWGEGDRSSRLAQHILKLGYLEDSLFISTVKNGSAINAYPDVVCMAFMDYYGNERANPVETARQNFRLLAQAGMRLYIYRATGYSPVTRVPNVWQKFHDRLTLNRPKRHFFSVFHEMSSMVLLAIQNGLVVDEHTIPDISIGRIWSDHWTKTNLESLHGPREKFPHIYPDYFPQSRANEAIDAWIYPLSALGEFKLWMEDEYLPTKFPKYLDGKVKKGQLPAAVAREIVARLVVAELPDEDG